MLCHLYNEVNSSNGAPNEDLPAENWTVMVDYELINDRCSSFHLMNVQSVLIFAPDHRRCVAISD